MHYMRYITILFFPNVRKGIDAHLCLAIPHLSQLCLNVHRKNQKYITYEIKFVSASQIANQKET